jgi:hypothetical protein
VKSWCEQLARPRTAPTMDDEPLANGQRDGRRRRLQDNEEELWTGDPQGHESGVASGKA